MLVGIVRASTEQEDGVKGYRKSAEQGNGATMPMYGTKSLTLREADNRLGSEQPACCDTLPMNPTWEFGCDAG
jgi:hypothetical protein